MPKKIPGVPSNVQKYIQQQISTKGMPKIKKDRFGIPRDQYGNLYYQPHGSNEYKLDNDKSGYWGHVTGSGNVGWNESDYKKQEIAKLKELIPWNNTEGKDKYTLSQEVGALVRTPANALNAVLSGNYEPFSVSRRRYTDPNFNPNSTSGVALDIITDPMIFPEIPEYLATQGWKGLKYIAPKIGEYAAIASKYIGNKAALMAELTAKYGKKGAEYLIKHGPEIYDKVSRFKTALAKGDNQIDGNQQDMMYSGLPQAAQQQMPIQRNMPQATQQRQQPTRQMLTQPTQTPGGVDTVGVMQNYFDNNTRGSEVPISGQGLTYKRGDRNSVRDLLESNGIDGSFKSRKELAKNMGITNYTGTAQQNENLKRVLMKQFQQGGQYNENGYDAMHPSMYRPAQLLFDEMMNESRPQYLSQEQMSRQMAMDAANEQMQGYNNIALRNQNIGKMAFSPSAYNYLSKLPQAQKFVNPNTIRANDQLRPEYQDGGMQEMPQEEMMEQGQEGQIMQMVVQALQQGADPQQIMQMLVQQGIPQEQAQMIIQEVMAQMQGQGQQQPQQMQGQQQPMMSVGGFRPRGLSYDY